MAQGTLQTKFYGIPLLLQVSKSRITNGTNVEKADEYDATGLVYSLHILAFISIGFVIPVKLFKKRKK
jgi:hypothetical protein